MLCQAVRTAVGALSSLSPVKLLPQVMERVNQWLSNPGLRQVTREEYAIMLTPDGELYDKSIIQRYSSTSLCITKEFITVASASIYSKYIDPVHVYFLLKSVLLSHFTNTSHLTPSRPVQCPAGEH